MSGWAIVLEKKKKKIYFGAEMQVQQTFWTPNRCIGHRERPVNLSVKVAKLISLLMELSLTKTHH